MAVLIGSIVIYAFFFGLTYMSAIVFALIGLLYYGLKYLFNKEERQKREEEQKKKEERKEFLKKHKEYSDYIEKKIREKENDNI